MAYYYVKSGGTATGDGGRYASQQTGSFPTGTGCYNSLTDAVGATTAPTHGDFICVSDSHALSTSTEFLYANAPAEPGGGVTITTVADANCDQAAVASSAQEYITGGASDWTGNSGPEAVVNFYGLYIKSDDNIVMTDDYASTSIYTNCTFEVTGTGDQFRTQGDGNHCIFIDCTFIVANDNVVFQVSNGGQNTFIGGDWQFPTGSNGFLNSLGFSNGGGSAYVYGMDLSDVDFVLINGGANASFVDCFLIKMHRCQMHASADYTDSGDDWKWGCRAEITNCGSGSAIEHGFYVREENCEAQDTTTTYRDQSVAWPVTGSKTSIAVDTATSGNATINRPFTFDLPSRYAELSSTDTDLITIYLSGPSGLTDADIWATAIYEDGTNAHVANHEVSSSLTDYADAFDPFRTGTALTADTGSSWTSGGAANYRIEIDTSGDAGGDCVPIIRIFISDLSGTVYIDSQVDLS